MVPVIHVNDNYLVHGRDFQGPNQSINILKHFASPDYVSPSIEQRLIESIKMEIADTFKIGMPFIKIEKLDIETYSNGDMGELMGNTIKINLEFSMRENPSMYDQVEVEIAGG